MTVSGGANFQALTASGIGNGAVIAQGVVSATDVWGVVPPGTRVCFINRAGSGVMFLNAATSPRMLSWLPHHLVGSDTCVDLPGAGTVVLVGGAAPFTAVAPEPVEPVATEPPQTQVSICQIKLQETLRLRETPGGRIIRLVWLYSEVPVFAVDGDWYLVEFRGLKGWISSKYRRVLDGDC